MNSFHLIASEHYSPVENLFQIMAEVVLSLPKTYANPIEAFDDFEPALQLEDAARMRAELIEIWRSRKNEFPWNFPY